MCIRDRAIPPESSWNFGRTFLHPGVDLLFVAGVASLPFVLIASGNPSFDVPAKLGIAAAILVNYAHFAASTVRLYTRPGLAASIPGVAWLFPLAWIAISGVCLWQSDLLAQHFWNLYQTWSPYHYAAQTFGIAMMYSGRSGVVLSPTARRLFWWCCMLPFAWAFIVGSNGAGLAWFIDTAALAAHPVGGSVWNGVSAAIAIATFLVPAWLFFAHGRHIPIIAAALLLMNGLWWICLSYEGAWTWAAISHGIQYLLVVGLVDVKDHVPAGEPPLRRAVTFYAMCVLVGLLLFHGAPALIARGTDKPVGTIIQVVWASVVLRHFIVDGFIWKRKRVGKPVAHGWGASA